MHLILIVSALVAVSIIAALFSAFSRMKETSATLEQVSRELLHRIQNLEVRMESTEKSFNDHLATLRREQKEDSRLSREEQAKGINTFGDIQSRRMKEIGTLQRESLDSFAKQLTEISRLNEEKLEAMREVIEKKLAEIEKNNETKLEKMRETVDEKLHSTLEKRLGEAFASVSERLEQVHKGLGEMKALTADVGDLKRVLTNVKNRGGWGEMQLGALLEQILTKDQYETNVATKPGRKENVEYAIKLPGADASVEQVWLPIDSKFPLEDYQRLITATEKGDPDAVAEARKALRVRVLSEAKDISTKYLEPPYTTDFGIMYLPLEGLYAEVLRIDGLCDTISRENRVIPAGPTTITALLNSLQMGFRTLAIEKRSSEVWGLLAKVKTEFEKFGGVLERTKLKIEQAGKELEKAESKTRTITKTLRDVQGLPAPEALPEQEETEETDEA